jgi:hypothetical protein
MKTPTKFYFKTFFSISLTALFIFSSCNEENDGLAPYVGSPKLSNIIVQDSTFWPKINWLGGYVSVLGINKGPRAALDSTLVFLVYKGGNDIHYPVTFNEIPPGAQDLTTQYGGSRVDSLTEDSTYTFWILKETEWNQISAMSNKILIYDSTLSTTLRVDGDTVRLSGSAHFQIVKPVNVYINLVNIRQSRGRLGDLAIEVTNKSNNPIISFTVTQIEDSLISAIGIVEAGQFDPDAEIWSVLSISDSAGQIQYGKANIISSPVVAGENTPGTQVFVEYPEGGLKHNATYYVWIANKFWDGEGRILSTNYYEYIVFDTN